MKEYVVQGMHIMQGSEHAWEAVEQEKRSALMEGCTRSSHCPWGNRHCKYEGFLTHSRLSGASPCHSFNCCGSVHHPSAKRRHPSAFIHSCWVFLGYNNLLSHGVLMVMSMLICSFSRRLWSTLTSYSRVGDMKSRTSETKRENIRTQAMMETAR